MRRLFMLLMLANFSTARAADFSFVPSQSSAQKELRAALEKADYAKALRSWSEASAGTAFAQSEDGRATYYFIIAENGLPVTAMRALVGQTSASRLNPAVVNLWKPLLNAYVIEIQPGWEINASWKRLFPSSPKAITRLAQVPARLKIAERLDDLDLNKAEDLWVIVTSAPQWGDLKDALKAIQDLRHLKQSWVATDLIDLAEARILYQKGDVDASLNAYDRIPKSSDFWLTAAEEKAWAYVRKNDHDRAVSELTTIMAEPFSRLVGPEPFFLTELDALRVCDYPRILRTSRAFKIRQKDRIHEIQLLAKSGSNKGLAPVLAGFDQDGYQLRSVGENVQWMPRNFMRDRQFSAAEKYRLDLLTENRRSSRMDIDDPSLKAAIAVNQSQADAAQATAVRRLQQLAQEEVTEYRHIIDKLHIVEAEVIERLYVDETLKGKRKEVAEFKDDRNTLTFPYSDDDIWTDELDHYQSRVKNCPSLPSATKGAAL